MRIKLHLSATQPNAILPINSNHAIAALVYATVQNSSAEFAKFLHEKGFVTNDRTFKMFTFSRLLPRQAKRMGDKYLLIQPDIELQISSPIHEFVEHFVAGLFQAETFRIASASFALQSAETLPAPEFSERMEFRCLAPITESVRDEAGRVRYLDVNEDWSQIIQQNLLRKYQILHGRQPANTSLTWEWDQNYLAEVTARGARASALLDIRGIKVRGWLAPFTITGSKELMAVGYETGYGSRNSMGFGMAISGAEI